MNDFLMLSWNVNGLRACARKGFGDWLRECGADVVGLQEVRALPTDLPTAIRHPEGWQVRFSPAERKGYSGVAIYAREAPDAYDTRLGVPDFDAEGRVQFARFGGLLLANVYFPNGSGRDRDNGRVPYKLAFYRRIEAMLRPAMEAGDAIVVMGDFNTAHRPIDLARPKQNHRTSGFLEEEREELGRWLELGWQDTFRARYPETEGAYTWWSQRGNVRQRNVGWRIDYMLASPGASAYVRDAAIHPDVMGSDHCPIALRLDRSVLDAPVSGTPLPTI